MLFTFPVGSLLSLNLTGLEVWLGSTCCSGTACRLGLCSVWASWSLVSGAGSWLSLSTSESSEKFVGLRAAGWSLLRQRGQLLRFALQSAHTLWPQEVEMGGTSTAYSLQHTGHVSLTLFCIYDCRSKCERAWFVSTQIPSHHNPLPRFSLRRERASTQPRVSQHPQAGNEGRQTTST